MCKMTVYQWIVLFVLLFEDVLALKNVVLTIRPRTVERSRDATLICSYDLEGDTLSYVKWYRGYREFYRFTPIEKPISTKVFLYEGINVDVNRSNSTQVVLTDIDFQLAGNFSCEVTTEAEDDPVEPVATQTNIQSMKVVQLPQFPPTISVGREPLDYGDILRANCTSPPARPAARLKFFLNDLQVNYTLPLSPLKYYETHWSDLPLELVLEEYHFNRGKLILRCVAQVEDIYHEEAVLELASARNPVPEKVSALDSASFTPFHAELLLAMCFFIWV